MESPLHSENPSKSIESGKILTSLINNANKLGVKDIVIPCVDQSSMKTQDELDRFINNVKPIIEIAEEREINLALETDLPPNIFSDLLNAFSSKFITVNYDIGNSAALGYDPRDELDAYGQMISDIHIKDRLFGGGSVFLGQGDADFDSFFKRLKDFDYQGPFIMQAYRDDEGIEIFKQQFDWVGKYLYE